MVGLYLDFAFTKGATNFYLTMLEIIVDERAVGNVVTIMSVIERLFYMVIAWIHVEAEVYHQDPNEEGRETIPGENIALWTSYPLTITFTALIFLAYKLKQILDEGSAP
jgi:hypothetical protein